MLYYTEFDFLEFLIHLGEEGREGGGGGVGKLEGGIAENNDSHILVSYLHLSFIIHLGRRKKKCLQIPCIFLSL